MRKVLMSVVIFCVAIGSFLIWVLYERSREDSEPIRRLAPVADPQIIESTTIPENAPVRREERVTRLLQQLQQEQETRRKNQARDLIREEYAQLQKEIPENDLLALCDQYLTTFRIPRWIKENDFTEEEFGIDIGGMRMRTRKEKAEAFFLALVRAANGTWKQPKKSSGFCYRGESAYFRPDDPYDIALEIMDLKENVSPDLFERYEMTEDRIRELLKKGTIADVARWRAREDDDWRHNPFGRIFLAVKRGWVTTEELNLTSEEVKKLTPKEEDN